MPLESGPRPDRVGSAVPRSAVDGRKGLEQRRSVGIAVVIYEAETATGRIPVGSRGLCAPAMAKTVLVTGGAGYIGSHTVLQLLLAGFKAVVVDNLENSSEVAIKRVTELAGEFGKNIIFHKVYVDLVAGWGRPGTRCSPVGTPSIISFVSSSLFLLLLFPVFCRANAFVAFFFYDQ